MKKQLLAGLLALGMLFLVGCGSSTPEKLKTSEWKELKSKFDEFKYTEEEFEKGVQILLKDTKFKNSQLKKIENSGYINCKHKEFCYFEIEISIEGQSEKVYFGYTGYITPYNICFRFENNEKSRELFTQVFEELMPMIHSNVGKGKKVTSGKEILEQLKFDSTQYLKNIPVFVTSLEEKNFRLYGDRNYKEFVFVQIDTGIVSDETLKGGGDR